MFGTPVSLQVKGGSAFKTWFGALLSIIIVYAAVMDYGSSKFQKMYHRLDTTHQQNVENEGTFNMSQYNYTFSEMEFNIQVAVIGIDEL